MISLLLCLMLTAVSGLKTLSLSSANIAYRQASTQSHTMRQSSTQSHTMMRYTADQAVDGDTFTCAMTPRTPEQRWWQVRLPEPELIQRVSVTIRYE